MGNKKTKAKVVKNNDNNANKTKPKGMSTSEVLALKQKLGRDLSEKPVRKRPRNPNEKEVLLRWKEERGGTDIGNI